MQRALVVASYVSHRFSCFYPGLFEPSDMRFASEAEEGDDPSLADMTEKAVRILQKEEKGFFLAVEGKYHGPCALATT